MSTTASQKGTEGLDPRIVDALGDANMILAIVDGGREPAYRRSWSVALNFARRTGATLMLADRPEETWADTPHHPSVKQCHPTGRADRRYGWRCGLRQSPRNLRVVQTSHLGARSRATHERRSPGG